MHVGLSLQPEPAYLTHLAPLIADEVDYYEVAPETLWREDASGALRPNGFHEAFLRLQQETGRPFVAHGVGLSLGTVSPEDAPRRARWLAQIARDHEAFRFAWYSDHLGVTALAGQNLTLPLPIPMTDFMAGVVRENLLALQAVVPDVGVENTVLYHTYGDPLEEPAFLRKILDAPRMHLVLDLHNVYTMAVNTGFDPRAYLARVDLEQVIEIHLAGGTESEPGWLPEGRQRRLDSHDHAVPDPVWDLLADVLPACTGVRGITLERMEGTVTAADVAGLRRELRRIREVAAAQGSRERTHG